MEELAQRKSFAISYYLICFIQAIAVGVVYFANPDKSALMVFVFLFNIFGFVLNSFFIFLSDKFNKCFLLYFPLIFLLLGLLFEQNKVTALIYFIPQIVCIIEIIRNFEKNVFANKYSDFLKVVFSIIAWVCCVVIIGVFIYADYYYSRQSFINFINPFVWLLCVKWILLSPVCWVLGSLFSVSNIINYQLSEYKKEDI